MTAVIAMGGLTAHAASPRSETRRYLAAGGDLAASDFRNDCRPSDDESVGGACFLLDGTEKAVAVRIDDDRTQQPIAGELAFFNDGGTRLGYQDFCGSSTQVEVPWDATVLYAFTFTAWGALNCNGVTLPTTGTVTADFYDAFVTS